MTGPEPCLACSAAVRDALDLLDLQLSRDGDPYLLVSGMDTERLWRTALYQVAFGAALVQLAAKVMRLPTAEVVEIIRSASEGEIHHEH